MKLGVCGPIRAMSLAAQAGYDYYEGHICEIALMSDEAFLETKAAIKDLPIRAEAFCIMFPGEFKVIGQNNLSDIKEYLNLAFSRIRQLGAEIAVFGSGFQRRIPDEYEKQRGFDEMVKLCYTIGEQAKKHDICAVIEPLSSRETNNICTQQEGLKLVLDVNHSNFQVLCDYFHFSQMGDKLEDIVACKGHLKHTHIAHPKTRAFPLPGEDKEYYDFFTGIKEISYTDRISFECDWPNYRTEAALSLEYIRKQIDKYEIK